MLWLVVAGVYQSLSDINLEQAMSIKFNPLFNLTAEQGQELWQAWEPVRALVEPSKDTLVALKLSRNKPVLTRRQLYMICATLANLAQNNIPEWAHEMLDLQPEAK
jgi:hypothetical protein